MEVAYSGYEFSNAVPVVVACLYLYGNNYSCVANLIYRLVRSVFERDCVCVCVCLCVSVCCTR